MMSERFNAREIATYLSIFLLALLAKSTLLETGNLLVFWLINVIVYGTARYIHSNRVVRITNLLRRLYYLIPCYLPIVIFPNSIGVLGKLKNIALFIPFILVWLILNRIEIQLMVSSDTYNPKLHNTIDNLTMIANLVLAAIGEELLYRGFFIGQLRTHGPIISVGFSTVYLVLSHFTVKWNPSFHLRDYFIQAAFALISSLVYFYTFSLVACIVAHIIMNSPQISRCIMQIHVSARLHRHKSSG